MGSGIEAGAKDVVVLGGFVSVVVMLVFCLVRISIVTAKSDGSLSIQRLKFREPLPTW